MAIRFLATAITVIAVLLALASFTPLQRLFIEQARERQADVGWGAQRGFNDDFLRWAEEQMPAGAHYTYRDIRTPMLQQWMLYRLLPARYTDEVDKADWFILYDQKKKDLPRGFGDVRQFSKGLYLARRDK